MLQSERMPQFMDALFERPLKQQIFVGFFAVKFGTQPVERDDGDAPLLIGITEDETMRRLIEVVLGNGQQ